MVITRQRSTQGKDGALDTCITVESWTLGEGTGREGRRGEEGSGGGKGEE